MNSLRYYILYWMTPLLAVSSGMLLNSESVYTTMTVTGITTVLWLLLSIVTEETMRAMDDLYQV